MTWKWNPDQTLRLALLVFGLCAVAPIAVLWSRSHAIRSAEAASAHGDGLVLARLSDRRPLEREYLAVAVESAPFSPQRRPPAQRFRMPGSDPPESFQSVDPGLGAGPAAHGSGLRLLGTMVLPGGGGVALAHGPGEEPRLVRIGESIGGLTLRSVRLGAAVFTGPDGSVVEIDIERQGA